MRGRGSRSGEGRIRGYGNGEKGARSRMKRDGHGCYKANFLTASEAFLRTRALEDQTASDLLRIGVLRSWGAGRLPPWVYRSLFSNQIPSQHSFLLVFLALAWVPP